MTGMRERSIRYLIATGRMKGPDIGGAYGEAHLNRILSLRRLEQTRRVGTGVAALACIATLVGGALCSSHKMAGLPLSTVDAFRVTKSTALVRTAGVSHAQKQATSIIHNWRNYAQGVQKWEDNE